MSKSLTKRIKIIIINKNDDEDRRTYNRFQREKPVAERFFIRGVRYSLLSCALK